MPHRLRIAPWLLFAALSLLAPPVAAQAPDVSGPLAEVRVEGTETYADIVRTLVAARPGRPAEDVDLGAERNRVYGLGTFETVRVSLREEAEGPVLVVEVEEYPSIGEVTFEGVETLDASRLRDVLAEEHLLRPDRVYNANRAAEAVGTLQRIYRQEGFPFEPSVELDTEPAPELADRDEEPPLRVTYRVDEMRSLEEVRFGESAVFDEETLRATFAEVAGGDTFDPQAYREAAEALGRQYAQRGYRQSGVDLQASSLSGGVLTVRLRELRIASVDTSAVEADAEDLSLGVGDLFDYDAMLEDVQRVARDARGDVRLVPRVTDAGEVHVTFQVGAPDTAGVIDEVRIEGNSVFSDETLEERLTLQEGDTFTSTLAEEDFGRIGEAYQEAGYAVASQPDFNYLDGTYVQRVTEYRIGDYRLSFEGEEPSVEAFVVLRELPEVGSVVNVNAIDEGLRRVLRTGAVRPVDRRILPSEAGAADEVLVEIVLEDAQTGVFQPAATYSTDTGFSASLSFSEDNLWGRAHSAQVELSGRTGDVGVVFGGRLRYSVPWLYLDAYDLLEVPTSVSGSVFSEVESDQPLTRDGSSRTTYPGKPDTEANEVNVGEYTRRETGLSFSVARRIENDVNLRLSGRGSYANTTLEPPTETCREDDEGNIENGNRCALPEEEAREELPAGGLSSFVSASLEYDDRDSAEFPRSGVFTRGLLGVGVGSDFQDEAGDRRLYAYQQVEFGVRSYVTLDRLASGRLDDPNHVLAGRLDLGHQLGGPYPQSKRFRVGRTNQQSRKVRGYLLEDFDLSRSYGVGSVEYRYDFGLDTVATETVVAIAFADLGWASSVPEFDDYRTPLFASAGIGMQLNLGFSGVALPALRFDYGFSERHPYGVFSFGIGPVF